ncbi:hypothetical protein ACWFRQ_31500 [Streptomyces niveus]|uniref:hypothetical protein n=1 Tax=Streptomyces niveus TaxID=193462 RepID=UPI00343D6236
MSAVAILAGSAASSYAAESGSADVTPLVTVVAKTPYKSGSKIYSEATLYGPNPVGTKTCVSMLAAHPYNPAVVVASKCFSGNAGTWRVSINNFCGKYTTWVEIQRNGSVVATKQSRAITICG